MRSSFIATTGQKLVRGPSLRTRLRHRRLRLLAACLALAGAGAALGIVTAPPASVDGRIGPLSYFPSE
ncbi:MAG: hypothetical protein ACOY5Y_04735 [Pseudomonadota bacterium]|jgi:hypothetical protein